MKEGSRRAIEALSWAWSSWALGTDPAFATHPIAASANGNSEHASEVPLYICGVLHDRVLEDNRLPFFARFLMGFPPREFLRLEAR